MMREKKNIIWIVGKNTEYIEKRIDCRRLPPDTVFVVCRSVEDALVLLHADAVPVLMLTEPEYAMPPDTGTYIPVLGVANCSRRNWKSSYDSDRCIPAKMLTNCLLQQLLQKQSDPLHEAE